MKKILPLILFLLISSLSFSQGEINTEHKILFRNEKSYGINLNSNGFGFGYRYGKRINIHRKWLFEGNFNIVKHEKEKKRTNPYSFNFFRFVYGKTNSVFNIQLGAGMHHEIYKKFDRNSVSVRWFYTGGVSFAFLKPIYYSIYDETTKEREWKTFVQNTPWWYIYDKENYFHHINEIKLIPGIYVKTGFNFEFSKSDKKINMIEAGLIFEAYPKAIKIMESEKNPQFFPVLYLSYRFGKVESGYYLKEQDEGTSNSLNN